MHEIQEEVFTRKNKKERKRLERRQWSYGEIQEDISAIQEEFSCGNLLGKE
jgi:hypothetical protein